MYKQPEAKMVWLTTKDQHKINLYCWETVGRPAAVLLIFHGMAEHAGRYGRLAEYLNSHGIAVFGNDLRGHGKTAQQNGKQGVTGENGFYKLVDDQYLIANELKQRYPELPLFILAHSFGSFVGQEYITRYGNEINGIILSGSAAQIGAEISLGKLLSWIQSRISGADKPARLLNKLSFGTYNKKIANPKSSFDWLSRDEGEVLKYMEDKDCGFTCSAGFYFYFMSAMLKLYDKKKLGNIPRNLPVFLTAGQEDPVGNYGRKVEKLYVILKGLGLNDLNMKLYEGSRHEILNELNRDEVSEDILNWINSHIQR